MALHGFDIIQFLEQHIGKAITIRQLAKQTSKSYGSAYAAVHELAKDNVLTLETVGAATLCRPNLQNDTTIALLTAASLLRAAAQPEEQRVAAKEAAHHLRDSAITAWIVDNEIHAILRPHTSVHTAGGIPVKHVKFSELYPAISENGIVIIGAENYWRMAGEGRHA